jgi:hypothetical protein
VHVSGALSADTDQRDLNGVVEGARTTPALCKQRSGGDGSSSRAEEVSSDGASLTSAYIFDVSDFVSDLAELSECELLDSEADDFEPPESDCDSDLDSALDSVFAGSFPAASLEAESLIEAPPRP